MPSKEELRARLIDKLEELFQLDQPDLDFGFYRIMHAKSDQVRRYLREGLPKTLEGALGQVDEEELDQYAQAYKTALKKATDYGAPDPEEAPAVKEAWQVWQAKKDSTEAEADVYDHLFRFFERYYDKGDFISRRYRVRETESTAAPYAIPYNGEEVKLHWANADQYYIKTGEYFSNFTFDVRRAREIVESLQQGELQFSGDSDEPLQVHFRVVDATEGEHNNVKESDNLQRKFRPYAHRPVELNEQGELVVNFECIFQKSNEYIYDSELEERLRDIYGRGSGKNDLEPLAAAQIVFDGLDDLDDLPLGYKELLAYVPPPRRKDTPPVLAKYVKKFSAKNTMDFFIHKDLGGFLRRELDFYIKNEVMRLDDIEHADAPRVETYLNKVRAIRMVGRNVIDFLAHLENFQKRLWLKKKFVVETNYCITLDRVPEEFYVEIASNDEQIDDWIELFRIDLIEDGDGVTGFSKPLPVDFLKENQSLILDTTHFCTTFKARLIEKVDRIDEEQNGLLVCSENFQASRLLSTRFERAIQQIFIDPPYNTEFDRDQGNFLYKDSFAHSSWASMMFDRISAALGMLSENGTHTVAIDDNEFARLRHVLDRVFGSENFISTVCWKSRDSVSSDHRVSMNHNYLLIFGKSKEVEFGGLPLDSSDYENPDDDPRGPWKLVPIDANKPGGDTQYPITNPNTGEEYYPPNGRSWAINRESFAALLKDGRIKFGKTGTAAPKRKLYLHERQEKGDVKTPISVWADVETTKNGTEQVMAFFGGKAFSYPKPVGLMKRLLQVCSSNAHATVYDYFAGSGTTGHAVIDLNRETNADRKYILVEMGDYFYSVLKPRILKAVYSPSWEDGIPLSRNAGTSHLVKYIRLESYEDTLDNLEINHNGKSAELTDRNQLLRYMLDLETRGSQSLLNVDGFADPTAYKLVLKSPGRLEREETAVDLLETFNILLGLRAFQIGAPEEFDANLHRPEDRELPEDQHTKLVVDGRIERTQDGPWWFRSVTGWVPRDPMHPDDGDRENVLVIWRKLTGDLEADNAVLDAYVEKKRINTQDFEFDVIYVNGSNNLPNLRRDDETWKVRLLEEEFMRAMWDVDDV